MKSIDDKIRLNIMLHDDWEVYGDGGGNPEKFLFDPAKKILDICDKFGAKYTFFAEYGQQFSMLNSAQKQHRIWAKRWEDILTEAVSRGHDVQLHFHPQWIGSSYKDGKWQLDMSKWSITKLSEEDIYYWLKQGKDYLEKLLIPYNKNYKVVAFRAGDWLNQPSRNLYNAYNKLGIKACISVRKGMKRDLGPYGSIDFTYAPSNLNYWYANPDDFAKESTDEKKVLIIPTYNEIINESLFNYIVKKYPQTLTYYIKIFLKMKFHDKKHYSPHVISQNKNSIYCNFGFYHHKMIEDMVNDAIIECKKKDQTNVPFVLFSHSKNFYSLKNFKKILQDLKNNKNIRFITTQEEVEKIYN